MPIQNVAKSTMLAGSERLRADLYRLLARILSAPPDFQLLQTLSELSGDDTELGRAIGELSATAGAMSADEASEEYHDLFIGVGRGELVPYASYYLTGFLHEKPLARLRNDMVPLGIGRSPEAAEPEDHAGALMDMMAGLIDGAFGEPQPLAVQKEFFDKHVGSWTPHFYADLETARAARLYRPVGTIGRLFMEIEVAAFEM
ncbi:TorD/DmsD family molecular chaperone [Nitratireductor luteus]|uniref:TorD/DmsD family molecular chaperone n=1 Tax=Nitratireductor luteus TaxID=2976980 RepID=UPI00223F3958|nr:molecular chaperone TorD family protein [Nitratireductor luteus]